MREMVAVKGEVEMPQSRFLSGGHRALGVLVAVFGVAVALLSAGAAGAAGPVQLKSRLGDSCLDIGPLSATVLNPCNGSNSQRWVFNSVGQIQSMGLSGQCVTINAQAGQYLTLWACQGPPVDLTDALGQRWNGQPNGQITGAFGACLSVFGGWVVTDLCRAGDPGQEWDSVL
jgi:Ricin-type beta-trefoil lectin domain